MSTAAAAARPGDYYLPVRPDWLARRHEAILEPDLPIVDPHHHLWDRPDWRYLLDELVADTSSGHNVVATVFVQARAMLRASGPVELRHVGETEFANGAAAMSASGSYGKTRHCAGIVGHADLTLGSRVEPVLEAICAPAAIASAASATAALGIKTHRCATRPITLPPAYSGRRPFARVSPS